MFDQCRKKHSDYKLNGKSVQELETRKHKYLKKTPVFTEALFNFLVEAGEGRTPRPKEATQNILQA